ncbi:MAG: hypothetical protein ACI9L9_001445 [Marivirga sp.]|jgi:hypothetical protein
MVNFTHSIVFNLQTILPVSIIMVYSSQSNETLFSLPCTYVLGRHLARLQPFDSKGLIVNETLAYDAFFK